MAQDKTLDDLFLDTLKDIYFAEKQILKALPKMAKAAEDPQLKAGFEEHRDQTEGGIDHRLGAALGQVDDAQPAVGEAGAALGPQAVAVRAAAGHRLLHAAQRRHVGGPVTAQLSGDPAHRPAPYPAPA